MQTNSHIFSFAVRRRPVTMTTTVTAITVTCWNRQWLRERI